MNTERKPGYVKLTQDALPVPGKLVWIIRNSGSLYIGYRINHSLSTDSDASKNCYWYGNSIDDAPMGAVFGQLKFIHNFSDVTVKEWAYVTPISPSPQGMTREELIEKAKDFEFNTEYMIADPAHHSGLDLNELAKFAADFTLSLPPAVTPKEMTDEEIEMIFEKKFDGYIEPMDGTIIQTMSKETFIQVVRNLLIKLK